MQTWFLYTLASQANHKHKCRHDLHHDAVYLHFSDSKMKSYSKPYKQKMLHDSYLNTLRTTIMW